ncbi:NAD(P)-binding Rossmann-fold superfamily protein [Actinidia rufa]|uniref:NAD(P)-binding Rossmann-fold superfamily protein n=1 Tax=Actinidia rufa TaxID=165716 RepID=A0A7J0HC28_9ERIC|nr:NAD(P)-binding Rossmann-fold superfamily protein [Actinidia rufa]
MTNPPRIAILGAGIFVRTQYIPRLAEISDLIVVKAIWSRTEESARGAVEIAHKIFPEVEGKWGETGLDEIIQDDSIVAVAVVLAGQTQVEMSLKLLKAGKHVLQVLFRERSVRNIPQRKIRFRAAVVPNNRMFVPVQWRCHGISARGATLVVESCKVVRISLRTANRRFLSRKLVGNSPRSRRKRTPNSQSRRGYGCLAGAPIGHGWCDGGAITEAEVALSSYNSTFGTLSGKPIWAVAENYRFEPALVESKKLVAEIGEMMSIQLIVEGSMNSSNPYFSSSWRRDFTGGFILDMGVHFIAGLRMIVGCEIQSVSAFTSHVDLTLPPPDNISSVFQLENGCSGVFVMVVSSKSPKACGTLQIERGNKDGKHGYSVSLYTSDGQSKCFFFPFSGVTEELKAFISDVSQANLKKGSGYEAEPRCSFIEGARDVAVLEAMLESGKRHGALVQVTKF